MLIRCMDGRGVLATITHIESIYNGDTRKEFLPPLLINIQTPHARANTMIKKYPKNRGTSFVMILLIVRTKGPVISNPAIQLR